MRCRASGGDGSGRRNEGGSGGGLRVAGGRLWPRISNGIDDRDAFWRHERRRLTSRHLQATDHSDDTNSGGGGRGRAVDGRRANEQWSNCLVGFEQSYRKRTPNPKISVSLRKNPQADARLGWRRYEDWRWRCIAIEFDNLLFFVHLVVEFLSAGGRLALLSRTPDLNSRPKCPRRWVWVGRGIAGLFSMPRRAQA